MENKKLDKRQNKDANKSNRKQTEANTEETILVVMWMRVML